MKLKNTVALAVIICSSSTPALAKIEMDSNKPLPQGLQLKLESGGSLPSDRQKRLVTGEVPEEPIFNHSELVVPIDSEGILTVRVVRKADQDY